MYTLSWRDIGYYYHHSCTYILHRKRERIKRLKSVCAAGWLPRRRTWDRSHTRRPTRGDAESRPGSLMERAEHDTLSLSRLLLQSTPEEKKKNLFSTHLTDKMATHEHLSLCSSASADAGAQSWLSFLLFFHPSNGCTPSGVCVYI